jgi:SM-20-related protein
MGGVAEMRDNGPMTAVEGANPAPAEGSQAPPFRVLRDFLSADNAAALLAHAAAREASFAATRIRVGDRSDVEPTRRVSLGLRDRGGTGPLVERRLRAIAGELAAALGMAPFAISRVELELVAHGDGAFLTRHVDLRIASELPDMRAVSTVYYAHREPRGFTGGALRLYSPLAPGAFVDVEPAHNSLVAFPSWVPHEVLPVRVPSGDFRDSRFSMNCWLYALKPGAK